MNLLALALLTAAVAVVQAALPTTVWLGEVRAPLLLALALHYALTRETGFALGAALLTGLVQDALGRVPLGCSSLAFGAVALVAGRYRAEVFQSDALTRAVFGAIAAGATTVALWAMLAAAGEIRLSPGLGVLRVVGATALGAIAAPLIGGLADRVDAALGLVERRPGMGRFIGEQ